MSDDIFSGYPYYRSLLVAISRYYDVDAVIKELLKMGWVKESYKLTPEIVERSVQEMTNLILHGATYPTGEEE